MRELHYLATAKFDDFYESPTGGWSTRVSEAEVSALGLFGTRLALGEDSTVEGSSAARLERVVSYLRQRYPAHTDKPSSCAPLMTLDWLEFTGIFRFGPGLRDWDMLDRGVYLFASVKDEARREAERTGRPWVDLLLCGSLQHVRMYRDSRPTRMGSGSDWLHDLAAKLVEREAQGDTSLPERLSTTRKSDQEFAARSCRDMVSAYFKDGPAPLHGHARVLCNFAPDGSDHRLIVATPLYVEPWVRPRSTTTSSLPQPATHRTRWQRLLRAGR